MSGNLRQQTLKELQNAEKRGNTSLLPEHTAPVADHDLGMLAIAGRVVRLTNRKPVIPIIRRECKRTSGTDMGDVVLLDAYRKRPFVSLTHPQRVVAESLLKMAPNYRYDLSGLPRLDPPPAPGPESAAAAAKAMMAWIKSRRVD